MLRRLALTCAALAALIAPSTAYAGEATGPMAGAPAVGDCFDMTSRQLGGTDQLEPVSCQHEHTSVIAGVSKLPTDVEWDTTDAGRIIHAVCTRSYAKLVGGDRLRIIRSEYSWAWFAPSQEQKDAGARWFSCHLLATTDTGVAPLPKRLELGRTIPDSVARCVTKSFAYTTCTDTHVWRASYSFYATGKATAKAVDRAADRVCPDHVSSRRWLRSVWDIDGPRYVVACYSKTRD